jgi:transposase
MASYLQELEHVPLVANARELAYIFRSNRKSDEEDAEKLVRLGLADPPLVRPVRPKSPDAHRHLALVRSRVLLVGARTKLINGCRGMAKSMGERVGKCSTAAFPRRARQQLSTAVQQTMAPLLDAVEALTANIADYDRRIDALCLENYPETARLTQVHGVGNILALCFVLTVGDPTRFARHREVGPFLGLVPRRDQSGSQDPQLRITKAGDSLTRRLLVNSSHHILGPFGPDCALRRWGLARLGKGGKIMKRKTVVAIARKLAVLLLHLWTTKEDYQPLYGQET